MARHGDESPFTDRLRSGKVLLIHDLALKSSKTKTAIERLSSTKAASVAKTFFDQDTRGLAKSPKQNTSLDTNTPRSI